MSGSRRVFFPFFLCINHGYKTLPSKVTLMSSDGVALSWILWKCQGHEKQKGLVRLEGD